MSKIKVAVMGYGHIGSYAVRAAQMAKDMTFLGVIELESRIDEVRRDLPGVPVVKHYSLLAEKPDVVILGIPTRAVERLAPELLKAGVRTVDCFDMHGDPFMQLKAALDPIARDNQSAAIMGSGVDPGISTMVRALFEIWAPTGLTYVSYGPGMSMGHTVAAKSHNGVKDALSITRPGAPGCHARDLYLVIESGHDYETVKKEILQDPYFSHDDVRVFQVEDVTPLIDMGHAIHVSRKGGSSGMDNQLLHFDTTFHNPASTAQVMVASARAVMRLAPGAHTMLEVPLGYFLAESIELLMRRLV
jgi:diaminopimelate dehydrogenase